MAFCKDYNARTADKAGYVIPVEITVYDVSLCGSVWPFILFCVLFYCFLIFSFFCYVFDSSIQDKSFTFILKTPPASVLLLKAAGKLLWLADIDFVFVFVFFFKLNMFVCDLGVNDMTLLAFLVMDVRIECRVLCLGVKYVFCWFCKEVVSLYNV